MFPFSLKSYLCFSKFKCLPLLTTLPQPSPSSNHQSSQNELNISDNSLYDPTNSASTSKSLTSFSAADDFFSNSSDDHSFDFPDDSPPDFATVFASQRFFFSSPGPSNSIFDAPKVPSGDDTLVAGSIAVQTYSPDPFLDFRKSMQEMVEAHELTDVKADWEFLHELLLCYLTLNPKPTHKFIIKAFSDLLISLMSSDSCRKIEDGHHCTTPPRLV